MSTVRLKTASLNLEAKSDGASINLDVQFFSSPITTKKYQSILAILDQRLPSIFNNKCFNDKNLPFRDEVCATPLGHLFEHILLEYLCDELEMCGKVRIKVRGETQWNWNQDPIGTYHIILNGALVNRSQLLRALNQTISLMDEIMHKGLLPLTNANLKLETEATLQPAYAIVGGSSSDTQETTDRT